MAPRTVAAVLTALALIPAVAQASAKPKFPRTVSGTISGGHVAKRNGQTNKESWTIKGVRFTLQHVRFVENTWTGFCRSGRPARRSSSTAACWAATPTAATSCRTCTGT